VFFNGLNFVEKCAFSFKYEVFDTATSRTTSSDNGKNIGIMTIGNRGFIAEYTDFFKIASTGTRSLALFYYWYIRMKKASFVFIDEFDAFYHFELSESVQKKVNEIQNVQIFTTTHNTDLMSNDLLRPDCYFLLKDNSIKAISELTEKELRQAHNLQKMYKAGAFNG